MTYSWSWRKNPEDVWQGDYLSKDAALEAADKWFSEQEHDLQNGETAERDIGIAKFEDGEVIEIMNELAAYTHYHGDYQEHIWTGRFV